MSWFHINTLLHGQRAGGPNNGHACLMHWQTSEQGDKFNTLPTHQLCHGEQAWMSKGVHLCLSICRLLYPGSTMLLNFNAANAV